MTGDVIDTITIRARYDRWVQSYAHPYRNRCCGFYDDERLLGLQNQSADLRPCCRPIKVTADRAQLQQVLMNLILNRIEALKDIGGLLALTSEIDQDGQDSISITDTGVALQQTTRIELSTRLHY